MATPSATTPTRVLAQVVVLATVALLGLLVSACGDSDDDRGRVRGSGETIIVTREIDAFDRIVLAGEGRALFAEGTEGRIEIETDDNLITHIEAKVADNTLTISTERSVDIDPTDGVIYRLGCPEISQAVLTGAGAIDLAGCTTTDRLSVEMPGSGRIEAPDLDVSNLRATLQGAGSIVTTGVAERLEVVIAGAGNLDAAGLQAADAAVESTGVGVVTVWVTGSLDLRLTGVGTIRYYGEPLVTSTVTGVGTVESLGPR